MFLVELNIKTTINVLMHCIKLYIAGLHGYFNRGWIFVMAFF